MPSSSGVVCAEAQMEDTAPTHKIANPHRDFARSPSRVFTVSSDFHQKNLHFAVLAFLLQRAEAGGEGYALFSFGRKNSFLSLVHRGGPGSLLEPGDRIRCGAGRSAGFSGSSIVRNPGDRWRTQHRARLQGKVGSGVDRSLPDSRHAHDAQLLGSERPPRRSGPDGALHEERIAAW